LLIVYISQLTFQPLGQQAKNFFLLPRPHYVTGTVEVADVDADQCRPTLFQPLQVGDTRKLAHQELARRQRR
jgi:hypothetical protein